MRKHAAAIAVMFVFAAIFGSARAHEHHPPHKGTLVEFGEEFAHLELVIDQASGKITGYVLDGEAEKAVRISQKEIVINVMKAEKPGTGPSEAFSVTLAAQESALSGEKVGDTSEFAAQSDKLKNLPVFDGTLAIVNVKGKDFKNVKFNFPKGNEEPAEKK
ncbi:MAG TPA: hypothetical protein VKX17_20120 [Planctomycetota bacterium]|nr:hypothetical protein [Planctomycetota bacterium]